MLESSFISFSHTHTLHTITHAQALMSLGCVYCIFIHVFIAEYRKDIFLHRFIYFFLVFVFGHIRDIYNNAMGVFVVSSAQILYTHSCARHSIHFPFISKDVHNTIRSTKLAIFHVHKSFSHSLTNKCSAYYTYYSTTSNSFCTTSQQCVSRFGWEMNKN